MNDDSFANLAENGGFEQHILEQTEGRGVDLIFDTYSVIIKRQEFVNSLAEYGRLVDFEVFSPVSDSLGVSGNLKSITFNKISFNTIHFSTSEIKYIQRLISQGIKNKKIQPLSTIVFQANQVSEAFKFNICSSNMGRTVVEIREEEDKKITLPIKKTVTALPKLFFSSEKSFVISGIYFKFYHIFILFHPNSWIYNLTDILFLLYSYLFFFYFNYQPVIYIF